jgi:glycosyltransferase involved in cell wall biosynthesis
VNDFADTVDLQFGSASRACTPGRAPLRVLTMTTLYPSAVHPRHGIFVETRLRKLLECAPVDLRVIAPVPWFPVTWSMAGRFATYAATPIGEERNGIAVKHPRFLSIPGMGTATKPLALALAALGAARELLNDGWSCDVIDAHYLYPDGVAAAILSRRLGRPFVLTARGSDVNVLAQRTGPRRRILDALQRAGRVIAVSENLKAALVRIGVSAANVEVLRNGVDTNLFVPVARDAARARLGVGDEPMIVSVGNLVEEKGHELVLRAARHIEGSRVIVVGQGPERSRLGALADRIGLGSRVQFIETMPQAQLASIYSAADVLALGSTREGWPNVLLESMACGTPVVATAVGGVREIVAAAVAGEVVTDRSEESLAAAIRRVLGRRAERSAVRAYASQFSWDPVVRHYHEILSTVALARVVAP